MGDRGRLVVPAGVRQRSGLTEGTPLVLVESSAGLLLMTREQAKRALRNQLTGVDLVTELLTNRRAAAAVEDA
jgi:bifunctional DNA-binding transcriptional regulator/antitoxin component of YhaV-PrlF toxin-antitoxin module